MSGAVRDHRSVWFLNTRVTTWVSAPDGASGISVLEHRARQVGSPLRIHHDEDEILHVLEGEVRQRDGD